MNTAQSKADLDEQAVVEQVAQHVREIARAEMLPRFGQLAADDIKAKPNERDPHDIVTVVDEAVEAQLTPKLAALVPGSLVVGEEACAKNPSLLDCLADPGPRWVVDPLDGTKNFAAGSRHFGSMVALIDRDVIRLAVIYLPMSDELFTATSAGPAMCNGAEIKAPSAASLPRGTLHTKHVDDPEYRSRLEQAVTSFDLQHSVGCSAVSYTSLVRGALDFSFYARLFPWDHAPGVLLLERAGGLARHLDGRPYRPSELYGRILVCNEASRHAEIAERLPAE